MKKKNAVAIKFKATYVFKGKFYIKGFEAKILSIKWLNLEQSLAEKNRGEITFLSN